MASLSWQRQPDRVVVGPDHVETAWPCVSVCRGDRTTSASRMGVKSPRGACGGRRQGVPTATRCTWRICTGDREILEGCIGRWATSAHTNVAECTQRAGSACDCLLSDNHPVGACPRHAGRTANFGDTTVFREGESGLRPAPGGAGPGSPPSGPDPWSHRASLRRASTV